MDISNIIKRAHTYTIEVTKETSLENTMKIIEDGLRVMNPDIFGSYIDAYVNNPVKDSYYLKINVVDTTGLARIYCFSIIKIWNRYGNDYGIFINTIANKRTCSPDNYVEIVGPYFGQKLNKIAHLLDSYFVFKEDLQEDDEEEEDTENDEEQECDCPFCRDCQSEDTESDDDDDNMIELTREEAIRLNREVLGNILSFMNGEKKAPSFSMKSFFDQILKERENKKQKEQKNENLNKFYDSIEDSLNYFKESYKLDPVIVSNIETIMDYLKSIKKKED